MSEKPNKTKKRHAGDSKSSRILEVLTIVRGLQKASADAVAKELVCRFNGYSKGKFEYLRRRVYDDLSTLESKGLIQSIEVQGDSVSRYYCDSESSKNALPSFGLFKGSEINLRVPESLTSTLTVGATDWSGKDFESRVLLTLNLGKRFVYASILEGDLPLKFIVKGGSTNGKIDWNKFKELYGSRAALLSIDRPSVRGFDTHDLSIAHAAIEIKPDQVTVKDLGSASGASVGDPNDDGFTPKLYAVCFMAKIKPELRFYWWQQLLSSANSKKIRPSSATLSQIPTVITLGERDIFVLSKMSSTPEKDLAAHIESHELSVQDFWSSRPKLEVNGSREIAIPDYDAERVPRALNPERSEQRTKDRLKRAFKKLEAEFEAQEDNKPIRF